MIFNKKESLCCNFYIRGYGKGILKEDLPRVILHRPGEASQHLSPDEADSLAAALMREAERARNS